MDLTFETTVAVYAKWLTRPPLFPSIFSVNPNCPEVCYDPSRTMLMSFFGQFLFLTISHAFSGKMRFYEKLTPGYKFLWCLAMVAMMASINNLARGVRAFVITDEFEYATSTDTLTKRLPEVETSLGYSFGYQLFEMFTWGLCSLFGLPLDMTNIHLKVLLMFTMATALVFGTGEFVACCMMLLEISSPILKVAWIIKLFELSDKSNMVSDFVDIILAPALTARWGLMAYFLATSFRKFDDFSGLKEDEFHAMAICLSISVVSIISWSFELKQVIERLGASSPTPDERTKKNQ